MFGWQGDLRLLTGHGTAPDGFHVRQLEAQTINARFQTGLDFVRYFVKDLPMHLTHTLPNVMRLNEHS